MHIQDEQERPATINIVPMIDVIFSILAFFIISSLQLTKSQGLPVNLPSAQTAQNQPSTEITLTIEADGAIALNKDPITLDTLTPTLQDMVTPSNPSLVIIKADEAVNHGQVVEVMDIVRQIDGVNLAIAAQRDN
ncbi:biopolymer transporter ExbD [Spirulina sp. CS-785/01]|uniref:ExbD/TolR family protein n=1 Tax=Spirulina sp. CS-785/01 TaxID=3021716 RepID=UPI002330C371|nr:biopolymer transporter ExbD [Spirulina sp. CS-785/01]MDB9314653.1 biopolymer transporter ExbD [Spirulina sp. CS-785/01]